MPSSDTSSGVDKEDREYVSCRMADVAAIQLECATSYRKALT